MGCDWIEWDKNFERKPKALRLMALTGADPDQLAGRLTRFWSWVDDHVGPDARLGLELEAMPMLFGGDVAFWEALLDEQICWLKRSRGGKLLIPRWEFRFGTSAHQRRQATRRQRRKRIREARLTGHADDANLSRSARDKSVTTGQDRTGQDLSASARAPVASAKIDWDQARAVANEALRALGVKIPQRTSDRELLMRGAAIEQLYPRVFVDSIECTRRAVVEGKSRKGRYPYLQGAIVGKLRDMGHDPAEVLRTIKVPEQFLQHRETVNGASPCET